MLFDNIGENINYLELVELRRGLMRINRNLVRELKEKKELCFVEKGKIVGQTSFVRLVRNRENKLLREKNQEPRGKS